MPGVGTRMKQFVSALQWFTPVVTAAADLPSAWHIQLPRCDIREAAFFPLLACFLGTTLFAVNYHYL
jgi:hypothetical protein